METLHTIEDIRVIIENLILHSKHNEVCTLIQETFNIGFKTEFLKNGKHFADDKDNRDIYKVTLSRGKRKYSFDFGQSITNSGFYTQYGKTKYPIPFEMLSKTDSELRYFVKTKFQYDFGNIDNDKIVRPVSPTLYDVLACLQKYDVGSLDNFCDEFGYDIDSKSAERTYKAVSKEYLSLCGLFSDSEMEILQMIS